MASGVLPAVTVVIPTRGRPVQVRELVTTLLGDPATSEVVVAVDDDRVTVDALRSLARVDPRVRVLSDAGRGKDGRHREGWARNQGVHAASSVVVLCLDDDLLPEPGLVSGHAAWHQCADNLVVTGYMPVAPAMGRITAATCLFSRGYERACLEFERDQTSILLGLWGGNFSVRREQWLAAIQESSFGGVYHEDRELGLLFRQAGLRGVFDRSLTARHLYQSSTAQVASSAERSAIAQTRMHRLYPDLVPPPRDAGERVLDRMVFEYWGALIDRPTSWRAHALVLGMVISVGAAARIGPLERLGTKLLRRLAFERGLRQAARPALLA